MTDAFTIGPAGLPADSDGLAALAVGAARRAHVPYSRRPEGAALRLADGRTVAAARLENASFPLTIPALVGAWALAAVAGSPPVALALTRALTPGEQAFVAEWGAGWTLAAPSPPGVAAPSPPGAPAADRAVRDHVTLVDGPPASFASDAAGDGLAQALAAAKRAVVPASDFRVGAVVEGADGRRVAGANVEHAPDWTRGLCAERVALVAARAAGIVDVRRVYVACAPAPGGTPCGGCRQVMAELAPGAEVVIWRGDDVPEVTSVAALLPGAFLGERLAR